MRYRPVTVLALALALAATTALTQDAPPYPDVADTSRASPEAAALFASFFAAKTGQDVPGTMAHMSPDLATYTGATLGWDLAGFEALQEVLATHMPNWGEGMSYPTRILGDVSDGDGSALVAFTDTPELLGDEIRILGAVDVRDGLVVRWVDHWIARASAPRPTTPCARRPTPSRLTSRRSRWAKQRRPSWWRPRRR